MTHSTTKTDERPQYRRCSKLHHNLEPCLWESLRNQGKTLSIQIFVCAKETKVIIDTFLLFITFSIVQCFKHLPMIPKRNHDLVLHKSHRSWCPKWRLSQLRSRKKGPLKKRLLFLYDIYLLVSDQKQKQMFMYIYIHMNIYISILQLSTCIFLYMYNMYVHVTVITVICIFRVPQRFSLDLTQSPSYGASRVYTQRKEVSTYKLLNAWIEWSFWRSCIMYQLQVFHLNDVHGVSFQH